MKRMSTIITAVLISALLFTMSGCTSNNTPDTTTYGEWMSLDYTSAPADNPLKGFMPYMGAYENPHSMEWFYMSLKDLMNGPDSYTFDTGFEPQLTEIASRGHQGVFRVYLDYPSKPSGIPAFLLKDGLKTQEYSDFGGGKSPDYNDPELVSTLEKFIAELGKRYDGDPRIGFITIGLIGFWGEWHTYPHDDWMASTDTQNRVLKAFDNAFTKTRLLVRYPIADSGSMNIGFHDDSFAFETLNTDSWRFMGRIEGAGLEDAWKTKPIGGELRPEIQTSIWDNPPDANAEDYNLCVNESHASWLLNQSFFTDSAFIGENLDRAVEGSKKLGYELYVSSVNIKNVAVKGPLGVDIKVQNKGVAPFYYDWKVQLAVLDMSNKIIKTWDTDWKLTGIIPREAEKQLSFLQDKHGLGKGKYKLVMGVANPMPEGKALRFADKNQDKDVDGWLTLTEFQINK